MSDRDLPSPFLLDYDQRPMKTSRLPPSKVADGSLPREKPELRLGNALKSAALKLRNRDAPPPPNTAFTALVKEAIDLTRQLDAARSRTATRLTATAMMRETLALCGSTPERIAKLRKMVEAGEPGLSDTRTHSFRWMLDFIQDIHWTYPPADPRRLAFLWTDVTEAELAVRGYMPIELFCVALSIASEHHPEAFGESESSKGHAEKVERLAKRQAELFDQIAKSWTAEDADVGPFDREGRAAVTFRLSAGAVPVGDNAGERLVNYLLSKNGK